MLCRLNTQYFPVPRQKSLKTCERDRDFFRGLTHFLQPSASYKLLIFYQFYLLKWRQRHILLSHCFGEISTYKLLIFWSFFILHMCNSCCNTGWKSSEQNPACLDFICIVLFPQFQCTDLWLTCGLDLNYNCISFCWLTYSPFFSPLTNSICRSVSLLYPVLFVHCFILDRWTICYDMGLWALGIDR